jgi:hypothetical protein
MSDHVKMWAPNVWEDRLKALLRVHNGQQEHGGDFEGDGFTDQRIARRGRRRLL